MAQGPPPLSPPRNGHPGIAQGTIILLTSTALRDHCNDVLGIPRSSNDVQFVPIDLKNRQNLLDSWKIQVYARLPTTIDDMFSCRTICILSSYRVLRFVAIHGKLDQTAGNLAGIE